MSHIFIPLKKSENTYKVKALDLTIKAKSDEEFAEKASKKLKVECEYYEEQDMGPGIISDSWEALRAMVLEREPLIHVTGDKDTKEPLVIPDYMSIPEPQEVVDYGYPDFDDDWFK